MEYRSKETKPVQGRPAWHGQYRADEDSPWVTVCSQYGPICYASMRSAVTGAMVHVEKEGARGVYGRVSAIIEAQEP